MHGLQAAMSPLALGTIFEIQRAKEARSCRVEDWGCLSFQLLLLEIVIAALEAANKVREKKTPPPHDCGAREGISSSVHNLNL